MQPDTVVSHFRGQENNSRVGGRARCRHKQLNQDIKTEVTKRQASPDCRDGKDGRRNGRGCIHESIVQRCFRRYGQEEGLRGCVFVREERSSRLRLSQETGGLRPVTVERFEERRQSNKKEFKMLQGCGKTGHVSKGCRSKEMSAFEAGGGLVETGCTEMASINLNALELGAVQLAGERSQDSHLDRLVCCRDCVPEDGGERLHEALNARQSKELQTSVQESFCRSWIRERCKSCSKMGSLKYVNPRVADTHRALMAVSDTNEMGPDVFFPRRDRGIKAYAYHEGSGTKLELEEGRKLRVELVPYSLRTSKNGTSGSCSFLTFGAGTDQRGDGQGCECGPPKLTGACVSVGGSSGRATT